MNPVSEDIKDILVADSGLGLVFKTNLFIAYQPQEPANVVTIYDTPGRAPQMYVSGENDYYPSFQIITRYTDYLEGYSWIRQITDSLHGRANETWNGTNYQLIQSIQDPFFTDLDEHNRFNFSVNFNVIRR